MRKPNPRHEATILEYSFFFVFTIYLIGFCIFVLDVILGGYRMSFDVMSFNLDSKCQIIQNTTEFRITRPLVEIIIIFAVYSMIFIWISVFEWFREPHWEHRIRLDKDGDFQELCEDVFSKYPKIPFQMISGSWNENPNYGKKEFLEAIGKRGLAYLSMMAEVSGFRRFEYLLFLMLGEFMMSKNSKLEDLEPWILGDEDTFSTVSDQSDFMRRIGSLISSRRSSTYESFDALRREDSV
ncbi:hypothetical protein FO519_005334 [Halicephalobus sp. NKZ332]|nr:hypothetical protein FO519_005334 [Halicephalobus sp. NKZ332]